MVKVLNQTVNVKDQLDFYPLKHHQNDKPISPFDFISVYGDSFISGFQEGGCFHAIVSMRSFDQNKITDIKANAHIALQVGVGDISAQADVAMAKKQLEKDSEINITVNWAGGGQLKPDTERWTIDSLTVREQPPSPSELVFMVSFRLGEPILTEPSIPCRTSRPSLPTWLL